MPRLVKLIELSVLYLLEELELFSGLDMLDSLTSRKKPTKSKIYWFIISLYFTIMSIISLSNVLSSLAWHYLR